MTYTARQWTDYGPAILVYGDSGETIFDATVANPDGGTDGGVQFMLSHDERESKRDAKGTEAHDVTIVGQKVSMRSALAGLSLAQFAIVIPGATLSAGATDKSLSLKTPVGMSARDNAAKLVIKPVIDGVMTTDESKWSIFEKAFPVAQFDFAFSNENSKIYSVEWKIFRDATSGDTGVLGKNEA